MKKVIVLFIFLFIVQFRVSAQNTSLGIQEAKPATSGISEQRLALLDAHIQKYIDQGHLPGGVFSIARKGKLIYNKSFGFRTTDKKAPYKLDDIFRLASMTKAFTTVATMQLYEQGKLGLDDPIYHYIPAFKDMGVLDAVAQDSTYNTIKAKNPITIRHLLTHTSGITYGAFNPGKIQAVYVKAGINDFGLSSSSFTTEQMVDKIAKAPLIFEPGERFLYGLNMEVLGRIIEVISGKTLATYFKEHIFNPLNMQDTYFYLPQDKYNRLVPVYTFDKDQKMIMASDGGFGAVLDYPLSKDPNHYAGGGGASGTAKDYMNFIQALLNNGQYMGKRILSRKTIDLMTSDQLIIQNKNEKGYSSKPGITFGLGFALTTDQGQAYSQKSPGTYEWSGYFNTRFFIDPKEELIFVGMTQIVPLPRADFWPKLAAIIYGAIDD